MSAGCPYRWTAMIARVRGGDGCLDAVWIDVVCGQIGLDRHDDRSDAGHGQPRGDVRVGRHDDLIPCSDTESAERQLDGVQAVSDADAVVRGH